MRSRREFLATSAVIAAVVPALERAVPVTAAQSNVYDFPAIAQRLARPSKHRQVFGVSRVADGAIVGYMRHSLDAYEIAMGEGPGVMHVAAVFYGRAAVMAVNDAMWRTYRLAEGAKRRGEVLTSPLQDANPFDAEFAGLGRRGATLLVCDNALSDWATYLVTTAGFNDKTIERVHADLQSHLVPGALLVPAGVAALNQAQEAHFTYLQATL